MSSHRCEKVASLIQQELSRLLLEEISDPTLQQLSITEVILTKDLKSARVFFNSRSDISDKAKIEIGKGFKRAAPFLRRQLSDNLKMRFTPELRFEWDSHHEGLSKLMNLFETSQSSSLNS